MSCSLLYLTYIDNICCNKVYHYYVYHARENTANQNTGKPL